MVAGCRCLTVRGSDRPRVDLERGSDRPRTGWWAEGEEPLLAALS